MFNATHCHTSNTIEDKAKSLDYKIQLMAQFASLLSEQLPKMCLCSKFEDPILSGYFETGLNTTEENSFLCSVIHKVQAIARFALLCREILL